MIIEDASAYMFREFCFSIIISVLLEIKPNVFLTFSCCCWDRLCVEFNRKVKAESQYKHDKTIVRVLLNCFNCIFRHLKLELLTQFPASNDEKYYYL